MGMTPEKELEKNLEYWEPDACRFAYQALGMKTVDPGQVKILKLWDNPAISRIAAQASTGTGKTRIEAVCILHFLSCKGGQHPDYHPKGLATAIDGKNLEMNLWPELAKLIKANPIMDWMFKWQAEKIFLKKHPETWFFEKRTWDAKTSGGSGAETIQGALGLAGHHAINSLVVVDESSGVPKAVMQAADRTLIHEEVGFRKVFQGGNPTHTSGPLWDAANKDKSMWNGGAGPVIMTGDPDDPERSPRVPIEWAREQIRINGRNDPFVQVYILGQFPSSEFNSFLGRKDVEEAMRRDYQWNIYSQTEPQSGIDVAYEGNDSTYQAVRQGLKLWMPEQIAVPLSDPNIGYAMSGKIKTKLDERKCRRVMFDATGGYANAVMEAMRMFHGIQPMGLKMNAKPSDDFFANLRTELYWKAAQWVKRGGALPYNEQLLEEATATRYIINKTSHKMACEDKGIVKVRLGRSPNIWDSICMSFGMDDRPADEWSGVGFSGKMQSSMEINPLGEYSRERRSPIDKLMDWMGNRLS